MKMFLKTFDLPVTRRIPKRKVFSVIGLFDEIPLLAVIMK